MTNELGGVQEMGNHTEETSGIVGFLRELLRRILAEGQQG